MIRFCSHCGDNGYKRKVQKAKKLPRPAALKSLNRISDNMERSVTFSFTKGLGTFKRRIPLDDLIKAYATGDIDSIMAVFDFQKMGDDLAELRETNKTALLRASQSTVKKLPAGLKNLRFDTSNPGIDAFLNRNVGVLIKEITDETRNMVQQTIRSQFDTAITPRKAAEKLKNNIGLTSKQAGAIDAFESKLVEQGVKGKRLTGLVERRTEKAVKQRALVIARTELTRSVNAGQLEVWNQGAAEGLIDKTKARKRWVSTVDDATSDICLDLDSETVGLDELFHSSVTGESFDGPPAHPNCRSAVIIVFE